MADLRIRVKALAVIAVILLVASACTGSSDDGASTPVAESSPAPAATGAPSEDTMELGDIVEVVESGTTVPIVDFLGNSVTVHQWRSWPEPMGTIDLFGVNASLAYSGLADDRVSGTSVVAADIEVCAADDQTADLVPFMGRFQAVDADGDNPAADSGDLRSSMIRTPVLNPEFTWPQAGECTRGWQGLAWIGSAAPASIQYVAVSRAESTFGEQHLYRWELAEPAGDDPEPAPELRSGMKGAFTAGSLAGWATTILGWRWVGDTSRIPAASVSLGPGYAQPPSGTELAAVLLEVCAGPSGDFPSYGIAPDGWNLIGPFPATAPWGPGYTTIHEPQPGECTQGWLPFAVPKGTVPTAVFGADAADPQAMAISWHLDDDEIDAPHIGVGFPNDIMISTVKDRCEATDPASFATEASAITSFDVETAVAVVESQARLAIYLGGETLSPQDLPAPELQSPVIVAVIANGTGERVDESEYATDGEPYSATVRVYPGDAGPVVAMTDAVVTLTEVTDDYVCGVIEGGDDVSVEARFGAPIWQPN